MKRVIIYEGGGVAVLSGRGTDVQVTSPQGKIEKRVEKVIEDKDIKRIEKIERDGLKELKKR